jgi:hypothetical protein
MILSLGLAGCEDSGVDPATLRSEICPDVRGIEALYWDIMNGVPRGDIPGGVPTLRTVGGTYGHPAAPLLGFNYPAGYRTQTDPTPNAIGVNVVRNDNQALWRYSLIATFTQVHPRDVLTAEINSVLSFLGGNANQVQVVCVNEGEPPPSSLAPGIRVRFSNAFIRFNGFSSVTTASVTTTSSGLVSIAIQKTAAPTAQYETEIMESFLPINYQLLFTGGGDPDSDGDGVPDSRDRCPNTPPDEQADANGCSRSQR